MTIHTMNETDRLAYLEAQVAKLSADNASLRKVSAAKLRFKVGEKGGVMVMGLQQFPVTLYRSQWERLIEAIPALQAFIEQNADSLKSKA